MASAASAEISSGKGEDDEQNLELRDKYGKYTDTKAVICERLCATVEAKIQNYYGVYIPSESHIDEEHHIFTDRSEALRFAKQHKTARFKAFPSEVDAIYFTKFGCTMQSEPNESPSQICTPNVPSYGEHSLFNTQKPRELVKFKNAIAFSNLELVKNYVKENPRYLISSGHTPMTLYAGIRYNALHVAAMFDAAEVADYILDTIVTSELTNRAYGTQEEAYATEHRAKVLLDRYLNTPDKLAYETPLHVASKAGSLAVVKVLLSYPECNREPRNISGLTPLDMVCSTADCLMKNKEAIVALLKERYYVPVLRCPDVTVQPLIGKPITLADYEEPNNTDENILTPQMQVHALAGPMSQEKAQTLRKHWKAPPKSGSGNQRISRPSLFDSDKGLERIGRTLAKEYRVQWTEYWEFLDVFINLNTNEGLEILESYIMSRIETALCDEDVTNNETLEENQLINNSCSEAVAKREAISPPSQEPLGVAFMSFQKFLEMIASRVTNALILNYQIKHEIKKLQLFMVICSRDEKYDTIDLSKAHSYLSELVEKNLRALPDTSALNSCITSPLNISEFNGAKPNLMRATSCVLSFILSRISSPWTDTNKPNITSSWLQYKSCGCNLKRAKRAIKTGHKMKTFDEDESFAASSTVGSTESSHFSDLPSYDVYLAGNTPTKLDAAVLQAVDSQNVTYHQHPFTYYWMKSCAERAQLLSKEKWPTPNLERRCTPRKKRLARELLSPSWHR